MTIRPTKYELNDLLGNKLWDGLDQFPTQTTVTVDKAALRSLVMAAAALVSETYDDNFRREARPRPGTTWRVTHSETQEIELHAKCRECGREVENGWGYWTHCDDPSGETECYKMLRDALAALSPSSKGEQ